MSPGPAVAFAISGTTLAVLAALAAAAVVLGLVWDRIPRAGRADFEIRHHPGRRSTTVWGRVPASKVGAIRSFLERDLRPSGAITVRGTFGTSNSRAFRLDISGPLDAAQRQRTRNFLIEVLGR